jgi:GTPase Era involved in 16S rRNA processing
MSILVKPEITSEIKSGPKPEIKSEPKSEIKSEPKSEIKLEPRPEIKIKTEPKPEIKSEPEIKQGLQSDIKQEVKQEQTKESTIKPVIDDKIINVIIVGLINSGKSTTTGAIFGRECSLIKPQSSAPKVSGYNVTFDKSKAIDFKLIYNDNKEFDELMSEKEIDKLREDIYTVMAPDYMNRLEKYTLRIIDVPGIYYGIDKRNDLIDEWIKNNIKQISAVLNVIDASTWANGLENQAQINVLDMIIRYTSLYNNKVKIYNIINKFDNPFNSDLVKIKTTCEKILEAKLKGKYDYVNIAGSMNTALAYKCILNNGFTDLKGEFKSLVAEKEAGPEWSGMEEQNLLDVIKKKIKDRASTDYSYEVKSGWKLLENIINDQIIDRADLIYSKKLELMIQDKKMDPTIYFVDILKEYTALVEYNNKDHAQDDNESKNHIDDYVISVIDAKINNILETKDKKDVDMFYSALQQYQQTIKVFTDNEELKNKIDKLSVQVLQFISDSSDNYLEKWLVQMNNVSWLIPEQRIIEILTSHYEKLDNMKNIKSGKILLNTYGKIIVGLTKEYDTVDCRQLVFHFLLNMLKLGFYGDLKSHIITINISDEYKDSDNNLNLTPSFMFVIKNEILRAYSKFESEFHQIFDLQHVILPMSVEMLHVIETLGHRSKYSSILDVTFSFVNDLIDYVSRCTRQ